jgi:hypothetical protein
MSGSYTVVVGGAYTLTAIGGGAGGEPEYGPGGMGESEQAVFTLAAGDVLQIVVGAAGANEDAEASGGGGGSFVWIGALASPLPSIPLLVPDPTRWIRAGR